MKKKVIIDSLYAMPVEMAEISRMGAGANCHGGWHASLIAHKLWRFRNTEDFYLNWYSIE